MYFEPPVLLITGGASRLVLGDDFMSLGTWFFDSWIRSADRIEIKGDGTYTYEATTKSTWKCIDPENRTIEFQANMRIPLPASTMTAVLSVDSQCLDISSWSGGFILNRSGHVCGVTRQEESAKQNPIGL